jgi:hypothetical protein
MLRGGSQALHLALLEPVQLERHRRQLGVPREAILNGARILDQATRRCDHAEPDQAAHQRPVGVDAAAAVLVEQRTWLVRERVRKPVEPILADRGTSYGGSQPGSTARIRSSSALARPATAARSMDGKRRTASRTSSASAIEMSNGP